MVKKDIKGLSANIMIVDDFIENLNVLSEMLVKHGYKVRPVSSGKLALQGAKAETPDLILLDINMPEMNGYEICTKLKSDEKLKEIPVIFISALNESFDKVKAFSAGGVDYITKPFQYEEVLARVKTHLNIYRLQSYMEKLVNDQVREISESQMATIYALAKLSQSRDDQTGTHLERVKKYCRLLAINLKDQPKFKNIINNEYIEIISNASILHDIGKVGIPDSILLKPGKLTPEEYGIIKTHVTIGAETLQLVKLSYPKNKFINFGIEIAKHHHEKWDGSGYPDKLSGDKIPLSARIMSIADVYDALKSKRAYKEPMSQEECNKIINQGNGTFFDPDIVKSYKSINMELKKAWEELYE